LGARLPVILPTMATSTSLYGSFTCHKSATWDWRLYFPSEGRHDEDFFRPEKSDGFGRVLTRDLGYQKPACYPKTTEAVMFLVT
jgi:hypothetical protein